MAVVPLDLEKASVRVIFVDRMRREGREKEWYETLRVLKAETGKKFSQISGEAMRRMGYEGPDKERQLYREYMGNIHKASLQKQIETAKKEIAVERRIEDFESAMASLPDTAPAPVEIDWIRAHPAMARQARTKDKMKLILVTTDDILGPPYKKAPSKSAVNALQHWCNQPTEFYKGLLGEQKKQGEGAGGSGKAGAGDDLTEIERLLKEVRDGKADPVAGVPGEGERRREDSAENSDPADDGVEADGSGSDDGDDSGAAQHAAPLE